MKYIALVQPLPISDVISLWKIYGCLQNFLKEYDLTLAERKEIYNKNCSVIFSTKERVSVLALVHGKRYDGSPSTDSHSLDPEWNNLEAMGSKKKRTQIVLIN